MNDSQGGCHARRYRILRRVRCNESHRICLRRKYNKEKSRGNVNLTVGPEMETVNISLIFRWSLSQPPIRKLSTQPLLWHRNWQHVPWQISNIHRSLPEHLPVLQDAENSLLSCHINTVLNQTDDTFLKKLPVYLTYRYIKRFFCFITELW